MRKHDPTQPERPAVPTRSNVVKRKLADLKEHPRQHELVGNVPEHKLAAMAADIKKHGLEHPVEILPDGTVVAGHQRVLAAKLLGWTEIDVIIRRDLEEQGPAAVVAYLIRDNLHRRQMTGLAVAHSIKALMQIQEGRLVRIERMKAEIGKQLNLDIRSVNRYLAILESPHEVQQAYDRGEISQVDAAKIGTMFSPIYGVDKKSEQKEFLKRLAAGEPVANVVRDYVGTPKTTARNGKKSDQEVDAEEDALTRLGKAICDLDGSDQTIPATRIATWAKTLKTGNKLIKRLLARCDS